MKLWDVVVTDKDHKSLVKFQRFMESHQFPLVVKSCKSCGVECRLDFSHSLAELCVSEILVLDRG